MKPALLIFNPRRITECITALERLPIDKFWLTGYTERQLTDVIPKVIAENPSYTHWLVESDDGLMHPDTLDPILQALADGHHVVTGYSNLDAEDMRVNLTKTPFKCDEPILEDYDMYHLSEVISWPDWLVPTFFAGYAFTGMDTAMWADYPFEPIQTWASDWSLCKRLQNDGVPIVACRDAFTWHVKEVVNQMDEEPRKRLLVGHVRAEVRFSPK